MLKESYFILKYDAEAVAAAKERGEEISEDGVEEAFEVRILNISYTTMRCFYWVIVD